MGNGLFISTAGRQPFPDIRTMKKVIAPRDRPVWTSLYTPWVKKEDTIGLLDVLCERTVCCRVGRDIANAAEIVTNERRVCADNGP